jgi:ParB-like chromosome segregation protein Spo0J
LIDRQGQTYENNPRQNDAAADAVARSIENFGFQQTIVVDEVRGHHRRAHP